MYNRALAGCLGVILSIGVLQAQSRLSFRAASDTPVEGWKTMVLAHSDRVVWVAPTEAVTANDIETARPEVRPETGDLVIHIVYTKNGASRMHDLTAAQLKNHIALVVDGKVLNFPTVMSVMYIGTTSRDGVLTGNTKQGLTQEEVDLIMAILHK
jgi:preprotein translocase subunit SecD